MYIGRYKPTCVKAMPVDTQTERKVKLRLDSELLDKPSSAALNRQAD